MKSGEKSYKRQRRWAAYWRREAKEARKEGKKLRWKLGEEAGPERSPTLPLNAKNLERKKNAHEKWIRRKSQYEALTGKPMKRYRKIVKTEHPTWRRGDKNFEDATEAMKTYFYRYRAGA